MENGYIYEVEKRIEDGRARIYLAPTEVGLQHYQALHDEFFAFTDILRELLVRTVRFESCLAKAFPNSRSSFSAPEKKPALRRSQSAETRTRWQKQTQKARCCTAAIIVFAILFLVSIIVFYHKTNGVMIVNTKTTIIDYGDLDMSDSEFLQWAESLASST